MNILIESDVKMLKLKQSVLQKLKCARCEGYLRVSPVMTTTDNCQICGKCFKILPMILPSSDKEKCVRLEAYEAVAEMLFFPCRYNVKGCQFQFSFNEINSHELECPHRFTTNQRDESIFDDVLFYDHKGYVNDGESASTASYEDCKNNQLKFVISDIGQNIDVETDFTLRCNRITNTASLLKYKMHIKGKSGTFLQLTNKQLNGYAKSPVKITVEGAISLTNAHDVFSNVTVNDHASVSNIYANTQSTNTLNKREQFSNYPKCVKCYTAVKHEIYHCTYGHNVCNSCKVNNCTLCTSPINSTPRYYCKNFAKGCLAFLLYTDLYLHSKDCEFGKFPCPLETNCSEISETLVKLKEHIKDIHFTNDSSSISKQSFKKDEIWIMFAFNNIFKCKFFYYENSIEIVVGLIGACQNSDKYKYEVLVESKQKNIAKIVRSSKCANWKSSVLEQCVLITNKELQAIRTNIESFNYTLNILNSS